MEVPPKTIAEALKDGSVSAITVTRAAGHLLFEMLRFGHLDGLSKHTITLQAIKADARVIEQTAEEAAVF